MKAEEFLKEKYKKGGCYPWSQFDYSEMVANMEEFAQQQFKNCNLQNVMTNVSDTLLLKASEYEDEANADFDTEGVQHNLNIGKYDGLMQAIQEINKHL